MISLASLRFDNHFARLGSRFSTALPPTPLPDPYLVSANPDVAELVGLDADVLRAPEFVRFASGNWLAQRAIDRAQQKDFSDVDRLLHLLRRPFEDQPGFDEYAGPAPADVVVPGVSCSS